MVGEGGGGLVTVVRVMAVVAVLPSRMLLLYLLMMPGRTVPASREGVTRVREVGPCRSSRKMFMAPTWGVMRYSTADT